jgi:hypothetical protein
LVQDIQESSIRQIKIGFEAVNRDNHPVGIAAVTTLYGGFCVPNDGFLGERYDFLREAG